MAQSVERALKAIERTNKARARVEHLKEQLVRAEHEYSDAHARMFAVLPDGWAIRLPGPTTDPFELVPPREA